MAPWPSTESTVDERQDFLVSSAESVPRFRSSLPPSTVTVPFSVPALASSLPQPSVLMVKGYRVSPCLCTSSSTPVQIHGLLRLSSPVFATLSSVLQSALAQSTTTLVFV